MWHCEIKFSVYFLSEKTKFIIDLNLLTKICNITGCFSNFRSQDLICNSRIILYTLNGQLKLRNKVRNELTVLQNVLIFLLLFVDIF